MEVWYRGRRQLYAKSGQNNATDADERPILDSCSEALTLLQKGRFGPFANAVTLGGNLSFAASAKWPYRDVQSRPSGHHETRYFGAGPCDRFEPVVYQMLHDAQMSAIVREPKSFNDGSGSELGLWQRKSGRDGFVPENEDFWSIPVIKNID